MRNVALMMSVSVDGYVAGPHGHAGALPEPEELRRWKLDRIRRAGTHIMGRVTYQEMAGYWPTSTDDYAAPFLEAYGYPHLPATLELFEALYYLG